MKNRGLQEKEKSQRGVITIMMLKMRKYMENFITGMRLMMHGVLHQRVGIFPQMENGQL